MEFLDLLDVFFLFSTDENKKHRRGPNDLLRAIKILLLLGAIVWCVYEIMHVMELAEPILFVLIYSSFGFALTILVLLLAWKVEWIEYITPRNFFSYLIPIVLISVSSASFVNRYYADERRVEVIVNINAGNDSFILKSAAGEEFNGIISKEDYPNWRPGDSIQLKYSEGLLG